MSEINYRNLDNQQDIPREQEAINACKNTPESQCRSTNDRLPNTAMSEREKAMARFWITPDMVSQDNGVNFNWRSISWWIKVNHQQLAEKTLENARNSLGDALNKLASVQRPLDMVLNGPNWLKQTLQLNPQLLWENISISSTAINNFSRHTGIHPSKFQFDISSWNYNISWRNLLAALNWQWQTSSSFNNPGNNVNIANARYNMNKASWYANNRFN